MITKEPKSILLAEDTEAFRDKLGDMLAEAGHAVKRLADGTSVMEELGAGIEKYHALILDLDMPQVDGFHVIEWMRERGLIEKLPVLCATALHGNDDISLYVKGLGAKGVVRKDITHAEIVAAVNKFLFADVVVTRKSQRIYRTLPAKFMLGSAMHIGEILNISKVGLFIHTPLPLRKSSLMRISFSIGEEKNENISPSGEVKWVTGTEVKNSRFIGAGIEFRNLSPVERKVIDGFIERQSAAKASK